MKTHHKLTREEFEQSATLKLQKIVAESKQIRNHLRQLELDIADKQDKIRGYQDAFSDLEKQLVKIQAIIYAKGTT